MGSLWWVALVAAGSWAAPCGNELGLEECFHYVVLDATYHCAEYFCPECTYSGYCDSYCGFCEGSTIVQDCRGVHAPMAFIGDGFCDAGVYLYDGKVVDLNCEEYECDGGDCAEVEFGAAISHAA